MLLPLLIHPLDFSTTGPDPGWPGSPPRLRLLPLGSSGGLNSDPSVVGGVEELRDLLQIHTRRLASSVAMELIYERSLSISSC